MGMWEQPNGVLRTELRAKAGREAGPGAAIINIQSAKPLRREDCLAMMQAKRSMNEKETQLCHGVGAEMQREGGVAKTEAKPRRTRTSAP